MSASPHAAPDPEASPRNRWWSRWQLRHRWFQLQYHFGPRSSAMAAYKNIGCGKRCFIMGNGPSLNKVDPLLLQQEVTFGVNAIYLAQDRLGFLPTYYVVEDRLVVADRGAEIARMRGPTKFYSPIYNAQIPPDPQTVNLRVLYDYTQYADFPCFSRDAAQGVWCGGTVTYLCLQLAYYMGFDPVYLVGIDHNYVKPSDVVTQGNVWTSTSDDPNHFHPDYFGKGKKWHDPLVERMELSYRRARAEFEAVGRNVFNATVGGKLEVFERRALAEIDGPSASPEPEAA